MKSANEYFDGVELSWIKPIIVVDKFVEERTFRLIDGLMCDAVWGDFCEFCGGVPPMTKQSFHKLMSNNYPIKSKCTSIDGVRCRILVIND